jgi:hypothetical protein
MCSQRHRWSWEPGNVLARHGEPKGRRLVPKCPLHACELTDAGWKVEWLFRVVARHSNRADGISLGGGENRSPGDSVQLQALLLRDAQPSNTEPPFSTYACSK